MRRRRISFHEGKGFGTWKSSLTAHIGPGTIATTANWWWSDKVRVYPPPALFAPNQLYDCALYDGNKAISRTVKEGWYICLSAVQPSAGHAGTVLNVQCCNCQAQGTKKISFYNVNYQFAAEMPVSTWTNGLITGTVPNLPLGKDFLMITDQGQMLMNYWNIQFEVN